MNRSAPSRLASGGRGHLPSDRVRVLVRNESDTRYNSAVRFDAVLPNNIEVDLPQEVLDSPTPLKCFPLFWQAQNVENHGYATPRVSIGASGDDEAAGANAIADLRRQLELQASEV